MVQPKYSGLEFKVSTFNLLKLPALEWISIHKGSRFRW